MSEERDWEAEALADGWNPNFEGDGKKDAKTFVLDGEKISGMLKGKISRLEERVNSLTQTNAEFKQYTDKQRERDAKERQRLISELEQAKAQAITDGDGAAAVRADREIKDLQAEPEQNGYDELAQNWASENPWYASNHKLRAFANGIVDEVIAQGYTGQAYFNELTRQVKEVFPEEFENPQRKKSGSVEGGGEKAVDDPKKQTWANLPEDAKAAAKRFEKDIPGFNREEYVKNYDWS